MSPIVNIEIALAMRDSLRPTQRAPAPIFA
jgi:hypothetical protein